MFDRYYADRKWVDEKENIEGKTDGVRNTKVVR